MLERPSPASMQGYYNPTWSVWLSVGPMNVLRSWLTPYQFVQNNPIMLIDPTGMLDNGEGDPKKGSKTSSPELLDGQMEVKPPSQFFLYGETPRGETIWRESKLSPGQRRLPSIISSNPSSNHTELTRRVESTNSRQSMNRTLNTYDKYSFGAGLYLTMLSSAAKNSLEYVPKLANQGYNSLMQSRELRTLRNADKYLTKFGNSLTAIDIAVSVTKFSFSDKSWGDYTEMGIGIGISTIGMVPDPIFRVAAVLLVIGKQGGIFDRLPKEMDEIEAINEMIIHTRYR